MSENTRAIGAQMATVLFNLSQNRDIPAHTRDTMKELQRQWDDAVSTSPPPLPISVGLQSVDEGKLKEALELLPQVMRQSLADTIIAAINEQAAIISEMKRTSHARRLAFEAAMSTAPAELSVGSEADEIASLKQRIADLTTERDNLSNIVATGIDDVAGAALDDAEQDVAEANRLRAIVLDMQTGYIALKGLVERAQAIISTSTYPNWHEAARAALSASEVEG